MIGKLQNDEAGDFPAQLDAHEAEIDREIEEDFGVPTPDDAIKTWRRKLLQHAQARLRIARDVRGHNATREYAVDASHAIYVASQIGDVGGGIRLIRLWCRLCNALRNNGHPGDQALQFVEHAITDMLSQRAGEPSDAGT